jgi:cob(I)alamin adenosyltransferase
VDELNAVLGVARALDAGRLVDTQLERLQEALFQVGAELAATDAKALAALARVSDDDVAALESAIDRLEADLPPLTRFILPGGSPLAAHLHFARTVCRRAERRVTSLATRDPIEPRLVRWLNRLSDLLFVMARWVNLREGRAEGRATGRAEEARALCVRLAKTLHPAVADRVVPLIERCSELTRLRQWAVRAPRLSDLEFVRLVAGRGSARTSRRRAPRPARRASRPTKSSRSIR